MNTCKINSCINILCAYNIHVISIIALYRDHQPHTVDKRTEILEGFTLLVITQRVSCRAEMGTQEIMTIKSLFLMSIKTQANVQQHPQLTPGYAVGFREKETN